MKRAQREQDEAEMNSLFNQVFYEFEARIKQTTDAALGVDPKAAERYRPPPARQRMSKQAHRKHVRAVEYQQRRASMIASEIYLANQPAPGATPFRHADIYNRGRLRANMLLCRHRMVGDVE